MSQVLTAPDAPAPASFAGSRVNRPALAGAMTVGQATGILPACFLIGGPRIALIAIGIVAVLTVLTVSFRGAATMSTTEPRPRHFVIAAASAAFHGGVTGYIWIALYVMLALIIWVLRAIFGWPAVPDVFAAASRLSIYAAMPFFVGSLTLTLREVMEQLYPNRAGAQTVFETAALAPRLVWLCTGIVLGCGAVLLAAAALNYQMSVWLAIGLMVAVVSGSVPLATLSATDKRPSVREAIDATRRVLLSAGYEVLQAPRTGDASVDPLLADLSLYVRTPDRRRAFAIDIKASPTDQPLDWSEASSLKLKVSALAGIETREAGGEMKGTITPVLVALTPTSSALREFAEDQDVMLFDLGTAARATETGRSADIRAIARGAAQMAPELIRAFVEGSAPAAASSGSGESGGAAAPA